MSLKLALRNAALVLLGALALQGSASADAPPAVSPTLKAMLGALPIAGLKDQVHGLVGTLRKSACGGSLTGCYATKSGDLQLYFFTGSQAQQTFLLVIDRKMALPTLLKDNVQKILGGTTLQSPIISISTTDYALDAVNMPPDLQNVVRSHYFNVSSLAFSKGVQLAARASLAGTIKLTMQSLGVDADQLTLRAAVAVPIPTDLSSGAGTGAGLAQALGEGSTMKQASADALKPQAFVEFQLAPGASVAVPTPKMQLTDATFFIDNSQVFGYKGNATFDGTSKPMLLQFQTPIDPAGAMELADFQFRMATPAGFTMEDAAKMMAAMQSPDPRLARYGGGFIRNIASYENALLSVTEPLSTFQLRNPNPAPPYKFGDSSKPFPTDPRYFNVALYGPLAQGGPYLHLAGDATILGERMGSLDVTAGASGLHANAMQDLMLKLGPLGRVKVDKVTAAVDVDAGQQRIELNGNFGGQAVQVGLQGPSGGSESSSGGSQGHSGKSGGSNGGPVSSQPVHAGGQTKSSSTKSHHGDMNAGFGGGQPVYVPPRDALLTISVPATCANPFEINAAVTLQASTNLADVFDGQGGANVDPSSIAGCIGQALQAALNKITGEYQTLSGYTAAAADQQLRSLLNNDAGYKAAKDTARNAASKTSSLAMSAFNEAGNAFRKLGFKKKKHHPGPDPRFAASVFDWDDYYDDAPDVVRAGVDLATHWRDHGFLEGRQGSVEFQASYYWSRYTDVQALCPNRNLQCALQHWLDYGIDEGRQGSAQFSVASYLKRYPDLQTKFGQNGWADALDDWINNGQDAGRDGHPDSPLNGPIQGPVLVGGDGGNNWSDDDPCGGQYVNGFRVRAGKQVDGVQFQYAGQGWADAHGSQNGGYTADVTLDDGEYIVRVDYRSSNVVDQITFVTNRGRRFGPYGGGGGSPGTFTVTPGEKLGCMTGRANTSIDRLIFASTGLR